MITTVSVKVMRSFDYCHFEVCLGRSEIDPNIGINSHDVDELRKEAARLADKAVEQYKVAKENARLCENDAVKMEGLRYRHRDALNKPESELTPEEKAIVKTINDRNWKRRRYDYQDDYVEEEQPDSDADDDGSVGF